MSIIIHFGATSFIPTPIRLSTTSSCASRSRIKVAMVPGIDETDQTVMTDDESSMVDIATSNTLYTHTVNDLKSSGHVLGSCFGLPYQDHNYGAPPPPTPPSYSPCASPAHANGVPDEDTNLSIVSTSTTNEETQGSSITRCICGFEHDDEYMICCDLCLVWQHVDCMGLDRNNIPETYLCEKCEPRKVDRHKAKALQARKKVAMTDSSDSEEDLSAKNLDRKQKSRKRKRKEYDKIDEKVEHTHGKRSKHVHKNSKEKIEAKRTKLRRTKNKESTSTADEEAQDAWEISLEWCEKNFETASSNQYTSEVQHLTKTVPLQGHEEKLAELLLTQNCRVIDGNQKKLISIYDIPRDQPLTEYKGKFLLASQFYDLHPAFSKRLFPFVLFYTIMDIDICVDASLYGNEARYIRRSCKPNAEVRHLVHNGTLHLYISSTKAVFKDDEITLPLDITAVKESIKDLECACESDDCLLKLYLKNGGTDVSQEKKRKGRKVIFSADEDSSQSFIGNNVSAKSKYLSKSNSQTSETTEGKSDFETEEQANERKKKTREERKIDAIMRAFDQMEKAAKRRQQALERQKANNPKSDDVSEKTDTVNETKDEDKVVTASGSETQCGEDEKPHSQTSKPKKGKRRRSSGTPTRRRSRTNSGGSDILSPEECTVQKEIPTPDADIVPQSDPVVETSCASTNIPSTLVTTSSTLSPVSPSVPASSVLKTKRFLLQEWLQEKSETNTNPSTTSSVSVCTDVKWNTSATSSTCYVQCTKDNPHSGGISAAHLRPSSSSSQIKSLPLKSPTEQGFTKKRWLRQAMFDCNSYDEPLTIDPGGLEGLSFDNGYLSPTSHGEMGSPGAVDDTVTPLKKRRLMRESVDSVSSPLSPTVLNSDISIGSEMNSENNQSKSSSELLESAQKSPSAKIDSVDLPASSKENTPKKINGLRVDLLKIPKKLNIKQEASDCESTNTSDFPLPDNQVSITNLDATLSSDCKAVESSMQKICDLGGETNVCIKNDYLVDSVNVISSDCQNNCDSGSSADSFVSSCINEKSQTECVTESADNSFKVSFGSTDKCNKAKKEITSFDDQNPQCSVSESNCTYFVKSVSSETKDDTPVSLLETQKTTLETTVKNLSPKDHKSFDDDIPSNFSSSSSSLSVTSKDIKEKSSDLVSECSELHPPVSSINDLDVSSIKNPDISSINNSDVSSINNSDVSSNLLSNHNNDTVKKDESKTLLADGNFANSEIQNDSSFSSNVSVNHIKPSESTDLDSKTSESLQNCSSSPKITCASATQKRKVSLSEYRLRMKDSPNKQMNSEQTKKSSTVTAIPETLPELVTLAPLPLFDTSIGHKSPLQTSPKILNKKKEAVKNDDEVSYSDISEHRENLTERLKREFGFDDDLEDSSSTLNHSKSECGNASILSSSVKPPPPPPPPPPRPVRPSHTSAKLAAEAAPSQFGFNITPAYARSSFIVPQVPSAQYIPVQQTINTPVISSGHPVAAPVAQCSVQPTLLPSPHSFAPSLSGTVLQPSLQHEFSSVNAQNYSTLIQQTPPPPPPPKSYSHMYKSTLFK